MTARNFNTVRIEAISPDLLPTEIMPVARPMSTTGKLEQLANVKPTESAKLHLEEALQQRVARVVAAKAEKGDAMARYNANLRYTPEVKTFMYDDEYFRLLEIEGMHDGVMLVAAQRATSSKVWHLEIPQMTKFENILFRGD